MANAPWVLFLSLTYFAPGDVEPAESKNSVTDQAERKKTLMPFVP